MSGSRTAFECGVNELLPGLSLVGIYLAKRLESFCSQWRRMITHHCFGSR
jgi:hypothetical protein